MEPTRSGVVKPGDSSLTHGPQRHQILAEGGTHEQLRDDLASEPMNALSRRVTAGDGLKHRVRERCSGVLASLLE